MSRVARKKLEKEAKKKKMTQIFSKKTTKSAGLDIKDQREEVKTEIKTIESSSNDNINIDKKNFEADSLINNKSINNNSSLNPNSLGSKAKNIVDNFGDRNTEFVRDSDLLDSERTIVKPIKMKTADKIISVEDEQMYFERKKKCMEMGIPVEENVLTVGDIMTAEDEGNYVAPKDIEPEKKIEDENNINRKKKLSIEQAPFEDVVKVCQSRKEAELEKAKEEEEKRKQALEKASIEEEKRQREIDRINELKKENKLKEKAIKEKTIKEKETLKRKEEEQMGDEKRETEPFNVQNNPQKIDPNNKFYNGGSMNELDEAGSSKKGGGFKKVIGIIVLVLICIYGIGCVVFSNRYFINTKINGINASFKTPADIDKLAEKKIHGYQIEIKGRHNVVDRLTGESIDLNISSDGSAKRIKKEQGFLGWPLALFGGEHIKGELNVTYNQQKLNELVKNFNIFKKENIVKPVSAYPYYSSKKKDFEINKGSIGSEPIESKVIEFVGKELKAESLDATYPNSVYVAQKNTANDPRIKQAIGTMNKYTKLSVEYVFGDKKYVLDGNEISKMFTVDSENDYKVILNKEKVRDFVRSLSRKYSTYGEPRVIKSASTGGDLKVSGGVYGWLIDRDKETDALIKILQDEKDVKNREPIYAQRAISRENQDLGNEYIEIDLTKQHMWFVKDGEAIVSTAIVSGNPNKGDATPPGIYPLNYKQRHAVLRGPGYASPVSYWMPFNGNIGIHDASWQPVYGGSRYLVAGSHGCINTPLSKVAEVYKLAKEGMPVVVHY